MLTKLEPNIIAQCEDGFRQLISGVDMYMYDEIIEYILMSMNVFRKMISNAKEKKIF